MYSQMNYDSIAKIVLLGSSGCGKSSLMSIYDNEPFNQDTLSTIGVDFKLKYIERGKSNIMVQINDTAGQERFESITVSYLRGASGVLLVFDVTDEQSFYKLTTWKKHIERMAPSNTPIILIGNKCDLNHRRVIDYDQAKEMALQLNADQYWETSAKTSENVMEVFSSAVDVILSKHTFIEREKEILNTPTIKFNEPKRSTSEPLFKKAFKSLGCNIL